MKIIFIACKIISNCGCYYAAKCNQPFNDTKCTLSSEPSASYHYACIARSFYLESPLHLGKEFYFPGKCNFLNRSLEGIVDPLAYSP